MSKTMHKTNPKYVEKIWGGRSLKKLFNKPLPKGKSIGESWEFQNNKYPVVVKLLDVKEPLSVQIHPTGKSELWYVIKAGKKSRALGGIDLQKHRIKKGSWIYIPSGTVHTIFPPAVILEVSQTKLVTYRFYDWERKRGPMDMKKGLKAIKPKSRLLIKNNINSFSCPFFKVKRMKLKKGIVLNKKKCIYFVLNGKAKIGKTVFRKGDTVFVPAKNKLEVLSASKIFKISS